MAMQISSLRSTELDQRLAADLHNVEERLHPDVVRIRHAVGEDWSGDPAIFFRVVLSDSAIQRSNLAKLTNDIRNRISEDLHLNKLDYWPYYNFRSETEQKQLKDPAWD